MAQCQHSPLEISYWACEHEPLSQHSSLAYWEGGVGELGCGEAPARQTQTLPQGEHDSQTLKAEESGEPACTPALTQCVCNHLDRCSHPGSHTKVHNHLGCVKLLPRR